MPVATINKQIAKQTNKSETKSETTKILKSLDWTVSLHALPNPLTGKKTDFYGIVRDDTKELLSAGLSKDYKVLQNSEILDLGKTFVHGFKNHEMVIKETFSLDGGVTNNITIQNTPYDLGGGDIIIPQIILSNNHDGTGKMNAKATILRRRCANGMCTVIAKFATISISHKGDVKDKLLEAKYIIERMTKAHEVSANIFKQMTGIKFSEKQLINILNDGEKTEDQSTQKKNEIEKIVSYYRDADAGQTEKDTIWNGWNAVTRFTNHDSVQRLPSNANHSAQDARMASVYSGRIAKKNQDIFEEIIRATEQQSMVEAMIRETEMVQRQEVTVEDILESMGM